MGMMGARYRMPDVRYLMPDAGWRMMGAMLLPGSLDSHLSSVFLV